MRMTVIDDFVVAGSEDRTLLVLLPGAYMTARDFIDHHFIRAVRKRSWPLDIMAVETGIDSYLDNDIVERLHDEVVLPARAAGAKRIWLAGISLGAMGALLYTRAHREMVAGLLLLSPFIGSRGIVADVERAGGIRQWLPAATGEETIEHRLFAWLRTYDAGDPSWPEIFLAYARDDRFAAAHSLLAGILPSSKVLIGEGGHDWPTWEILWEQLLQISPFGI
jgi:pimeloyl-ACP methyl ester carboxylesterase